MLLEHEPNNGLDMDALVSVCFLEHIGFGHGCFSVCFCYTNGIPAAPQKTPGIPPCVGFVPRRNMNRAPTTRA